ncbi:MFS transporter [Arthrobacter sp. NEB 688]|uniref:MFS transporter n=1 Tax=Arthrobacter sp. NEB 688 TaxID=904039 RepID=UPI00156552C3|nr:MFS transporter [Arthrobacter sp. NEB 688]QKE84996.1 MFS transporter [Arthrobacter sp. NEB 688]
MTTVTLAPYRRVLSRPSLRRTLLLGAFSRLALFATPVLLTIHVVTTLGRSYTQAGLVGGLVTVAIAVGSPWRGRLLDRRGLRALVGPSVVISGACWTAAPFVGYGTLLVLGTIGGLFLVPVTSIVRQAVMAAVPEEDRRTAISLDSAVLELVFMVAPAAGVWAATQWGSTGVLFVVQVLGVVTGAVLWLVDPPLRGESERETHAAGVPRRTWLLGPFLPVVLTVLATAVVLSGSDLGFVAAVRGFGETAALGLVIVFWGFGSLVGGLVYGALSREVPSRWLLLTLVVVTAPMAWAQTPLQLAVLALVAGLLCAPTITATVDEAVRAVPVRVRGEAMGWHGSALTGGGALGAPLAGYAADHYGPSSGFVVVAAVGLLVVVLVSVWPGRRTAAVEMPSPAAERSAH